MPTLEAALSESMQGSMSNEIGRVQSFNGAAGELNGLFTQAANVAMRRVQWKPSPPASRDFAALVDGRHAYDARGRAGRDRLPRPSGATRWQSSAGTATSACSITSLRCLVRFG